MITSYTPNTIDKNTAYYRVVIDDGTDIVTSDEALISVKNAVDFLITDRTADDVRYWQELRDKVINDTATDEELAEWLTMELKGCLNYKDFNRINTILNYLRTKGIQVVYPTEPKTDWEINDEVTQTEINNFLANIQVIRNIKGTPSASPQVPSAITDYNDMNDIETILLIGDETLHNTQLAWKYSGEINSGGSY